MLSPIPYVQREQACLVSIYTVHIKHTVFFIYRHRFLKGGITIPGINVPYYRDNFIPGINSVPERRNSAIQGINPG